MSFGKKILAAARELKAEGKFLADLRPVERAQLILDKLEERGHRGSQLPC